MSDTLREQLFEKYIYLKESLREQESRYKKNYIRGYISCKKIHGKTYYYLQHREGRKIKSRYIPEKDLEGLRQYLEEQKNWEKDIKSIKSDLEIIEKALGKDYIEEYKKNKGIM